jgi:hypothetical protein
MSPVDPPPKPGIVDIVPVETVEPLIANHERELRVLRAELEEALRVAERAEQDLRTHPAAAVFDDAFEEDVLAHVARSVAEVTLQGRDFPTVGRRETAGSVPVAAEAHGGGAPEADASSETPVNPLASSPRQASNQSSPPRPRTVVVDRGAPRTVVVDRGSPEGTTSSPIPTPIAPLPAAPVFAADPVAEQYINWQASQDAPVEASRNGAASDRRGTRGAKGSHASRLPARLLIQAGVVIVIIALVLLKLG